MAKYKTLTGGDGISGQTGLQVRGILNDMVPADAYYLPEDFDFSLSLASFSNRTWVITYEHTLANNITIPEGVTLLFDGGRISGAYTITGNVTKILNPRNTHIFGLTTNFTGSWTETKATPMWWGAKTTPDPNTFTGVESASPAIQKLFDSPFDVEFPNGYYYIDTAINITRPITANFGTRYETQATAGIRAGRTWRNDHVRFYTDQNINFWNLRTHGIYLLGGVMDVWNAPTWSSAIYYMHCNYRCFRGEVSGYCIGTKTLVRSGSMGRGFHWDTENATVSYGYACNIIVNIYTYCIPIGIEIGDREVAKQVVTGTWSNLWYSYDTWIEGARVACILRGYTYAKIFGQDESVLNSNERDTRIAQIYDCQTLDLHIADLFNREEPIGSGYYYHKQSGAYMLNETGVRLVGILHPLLYGGYTGKPFIDDSNIRPGQTITQLRRTGDNLSTFISELHNTLPLLAATAEVVSIKVYDGSSGIDFDTDLDDGATLSLSETNRITFQNDPINLFKYRGKPVYFNVTDARTTDFIEVRLRNSSEFRVNDFYLSLADGRSATQRIQLILVKNNGTRTMQEWPFNESVKAVSGRRLITFKTDASLYREVILRLIGFLGVYSQNRIEDFATYGDPESSQSFTNRLEREKSITCLTLSQTGTDAPTMVQNLNYYNKAITTSYQSVGTYRVNISTVVDKTWPIVDEIFTSAGSIKVTRTGNSYFTIETRNPGGDLTNGILTNFPLKITEFW